MLKIFLAHAKEDKKVVTDLYYRLKEKGYKPWLDKENLLPGQNWRAEIHNAIRSSQVFIACLSNRSVKKEGYVQDEFKMALMTCARKPVGSIYLIPIRLDNCDIPELRQEDYGLNLRDIQWIDFFEEDGFDRLIKAIERKAIECAANVRAVENSRDVLRGDSFGTSSPAIPPFPKKEDSSDRSQDGNSSVENTINELKLSKTLIPHINAHTESNQSKDMDEIFQKYKALKNNVIQRYEKYRSIVEKPANIGIVSKKIEEVKGDRFTLALAGEVKAGKSTFINALLGEMILPTGFLQSTSAIIEIFHSRQKCVEVVYGNGVKTRVGQTHLNF